MRDLKHLIYFESLLENADNDLVKQAQAEGKLAIGSGSTDICKSISLTCADRIGNSRVVFTFNDNFLYRNRRIDITSA